ncbi:hypothetical protein DMI65_11125 [Escherichia coli]|nr:hypothetical protein [Escherichia coli]
MKLVREARRSAAIPDCAMSSVWQKPTTFLPSMKPNAVAISQINLRDAYVDHLFGYINVKTLRRSSW